jgi:hypothetical protein
MYLNALEYLEEEREAWRPYEALASLTDEQLEVPIDEAHEWSGRDLIAHLVAWQANALDVAKELAVSETSATKERSDAEWDERGDAINLDIQVEWRALPMDEVRRRLREVPGELRGYLTVVPETRWIKHADNLSFFIDETIDHYADHAADLEAILDAAASATAVGDDAPDDLATQKARAAD